MRDAAIHLRIRIRVQFSVLSRIGPAAARFVPDSGRPCVGDERYTLPQHLKSSSVWKGVDSVSAVDQRRTRWKRIVVHGQRLAGGWGHQPGLPPFDEELRDRDHQARYLAHPHAPDLSTMRALLPEHRRRDGAFALGQLGRLGFVGCARRISVLARALRLHRRHVGFQGVVQRSRRAPRSSPGLLRAQAFSGWATQVPRAADSASRVEGVPRAVGRTSTLDDINPSGCEISGTDRASTAKPRGGHGRSGRWRAHVATRSGAGLSVRLDTQYWRVKAGEGTETASFPTSTSTTGLREPHGALSGRTSAFAYSVYRTVMRRRRGPICPDFRAAEGTR